MVPMLARLLIMSISAAHAGHRAELSSAPASGWAPAPAPLMTKWAKDVSPARARVDYPRPNCVRKDWKSLNGIWEFAFDETQPKGPTPLRILVPWTFEAALSGIGKGKEIHERVLYRRTFGVPAAWKDRR